MADDGPDHPHLGDGSGMKLDNETQHNFEPDMLTFNLRSVGDKETCFWNYSIDLF
jgi:hypothetical protein